MFTLIQLHPEGSDCTAPYEVEFKQPYTLADMLNDISLKSGEWGNITVCDETDVHNDLYIASYGRGKIPIPAPDIITNREIRSATSSGGWSAMDYCIRLKEENTQCQKK